MKLNKEQLGEETNEWKVTGLVKTGTLALTAALMSIVIALSGCGEKTSSNGGTTSSSSSTTTTSSTNTGVDTTQTEEITTGSEVETTDSSKENESTTSSKGETQTTTSTKPKNDNTTTKKQDPTTTKKPNSTTSGSKPTTPAPTQPQVNPQDAVNKVADQLKSWYKTAAGKTVSDSEYKALQNLCTIVKESEKYSTLKSLPDYNKTSVAFYRLGSARWELAYANGSGTTSIPVKLNDLINNSAVKKYTDDFEKEMLAMMFKPFNTDEFMNLLTRMKNYAKSVNNEVIREWIQNDGNCWGEIMELKMNEMEDQISTSKAMGVFSNYATVKAPVTNQGGVQLLSLDMPTLEEQRNSSYDAMINGYVQNRYSNVEITGLMGPKKLIK